MFIASVPSVRPQVSEFSEHNPVSTEIYSGQLETHVISLELSCIVKWVPQVCIL